MSATQNRSRSCYPSRSSQLTAIMGSKGSVQTWLRLREEFGIHGTDAGPVVAWAIATRADAARSGSLPPAAPATPPS